MSDEDRKFLDEAIKSMSVDIPKQMRLALTALTVDDSEAEEENVEAIIQGKIEALEKLGEFCEDLDMAKDLLSMDGLSSLVTALSHRDARVRALSAHVLGGCAQNEPTVQAKMVEASIVDTLCTAWDAESDAEARRKMFFALSAVIRGHDAAIRAFLALKGAARVVSAAQDADGRVRRKAVFLGRALCASGGAAAAQQLVDAGALAPALEAAGKEDDEAENGLRLVDRLVRGCPACAVGIDTTALKGMAAAFRARAIADAIEDGDSPAEAEDSDDVRLADAIVNTVTDAQQGKLSPAAEDAPPAGDVAPAAASEEGAGAGAGAAGPLLLGV